MRRCHRNRTRTRAFLVAACGVLAMLALPSFAAARDRNHDRIPDRWEKRHHLSLNVSQAGRDQDRDQLDNRGEFRTGDNPRDNDSDDDGVMDGDENAGTIASFDPGTGRLVIALFGGDTVSGAVTDATRIRCGHEGDRGDRQPGDDSEASGSRGRDGEGEHPANCTTDALAQGAVVEEAELEMEDGVATFEKVELAQ